MSQEYDFEIYKALKTFYKFDKIFIVCFGFFLKIFLIFKNNN